VEGHPPAPSHPSLPPPPAPDHGSENHPGSRPPTNNGDQFLFAAVNVKTRIRAHIERFEFSGHATRDELVRFAEKCSPRSIDLTHGDPPARAWFAEQLKEKLPKCKVLDPVPLQTYQV